MTDEKRPAPTPAPEPPRSDGEPLDVTWDDDTLPGFAPGDSIFDRVTEIPEIPLEVHAKQMMSVPSEGDEPHPPGFARETEAAPDSTLTLELELASLPPPLFRPGSTTEPSPAPLELETARPLGPDPAWLELASADGKLEAALGEIKDRYAMGDYSGALVTAESILENDPEHPEATRYASRCRQVLTEMYAARIGQLSQVARVAVAPDQIRWLSLDHRAGFLLSLVDGRSTLDEVLDISGMPRLDALRILFSLLEERVIVLGTKP